MRYILLEWSELCVNIWRKRTQREFEEVSVLNWNWNPSEQTCHPPAANQSSLHSSRWFSSNPWPVRDNTEVRLWNVSDDAGKMFMHTDRRRPFLPSCPTPWCIIPNRSHGCVENVRTPTSACLVERLTWLDYEWKKLCVKFCFVVTRHDWKWIDYCISDVWTLASLSVLFVW